MIRNLLFIVSILISLHTMAATHTVTSNKGQGPGSLSGIIADAQPGDIIVFSKHVFYPGGSYNTIILNSEVNIDKDLTIKGPVDQDGNAFVLIKVPVTAQEAADHNLTASDYRLFNISGKNAVSISNIRFKGGDISGKIQWGGIINVSNADLNIRNSSFCDAKAYYGGAIHINGGSLFLVKDSLSNNRATLGGGAIRSFRSVLDIDDSRFQGNTETTNHGGAIHTDGLLMVTNSVFRNNTGFFSGGAIAGFGPTYLYHNSFIDNIVTENHSYGGAVRLQDDTGIVNCMFIGNSAVRDGGAIYGSLSRLRIAGTTCRDNRISNGKGGAIHAVTGNQRADLYNCIITGNYRGNTEDNIRLANGNMAYSVYGTDNDLDNIADNIHNTKAPASSVFTGNGIEISPAGEAVKAGTLVGQLGDDFYYRDMDDNQWKSFTTGNTLAFDISNTVNYGLGQGAEIYTISLNGMSRVQTHSYYNAGAYALKCPAKTPGLVVTSNSDLCDPCRGITLRDAIGYAGTAAVNFENRITFDPDVFKPTGNPADNTIILNSEVSIDKNLTIEGPVDQDGNAFILIKALVTAQEAVDHNLTASDYKLFNISGKNAVNISNIRFKAGNGIIHCLGSDLVINNSSFSDSKSPAGGAIHIQESTIYINHSKLSNNIAGIGGTIFARNCNLYVYNSLFTDNTAGTGGAIYNDAYTITTVIGSTFTSNRAYYSGAGIYCYSWGELNIFNSILTGNMINNVENNIFNADTAPQNIFNMAYSVYGTDNDLDNIVENIHNTKAPASSVFTGNGIEISPAGEAVKAGTLVGQLGDDFYYRDMDDNQWKSITTGNTLAFDITNTVDYGLGQGADIFTTSLNGGSRVQTHGHYNAGAYVLDNRSNLTIDAIPGQVYTGSAILPEVTVRSGNTVLIKGTDYDLVYSNHINVGTATVTVTCKGSYSGIFRVTFGITARQITTVDAIPDQIHTGAAITPGPVVKSDGVLLAAGVDYEVSYLNNTDTGTATVVITGKGNYSGTLHAMFNIVKALNVDILEIITDGAVYDAAAGLYVADCGRTDVVITVVPVDHTVRIIYNGIEVNPFTVTVEKAGFYTVNFTVVSRDYSLSKDYSLVIEKRFEFDEVVVTRWNNTMTVINNPLNNGGYTFTGWKWFRNGSEMAAGQSVSTGNDGYPLSTSDRYYVELTVNGYDRPLRTCEGTPGIRNTGFRVWPNPGSRSGTVSIETDPELMPDAVIEIYNVLGVCTCRTQATGRITLVSLPSVQGLYIIRLKGKDFEENIKMVVN